MEASPPRRGSRPPSPPSETTLSCLPLEILEKVVSHLPVRDAVRTSAVSRAWRRLWESAPGLVLKWDYGADPAVADDVLARCSGPVRVFNFDLREESSFWRADGWVRLLAGKGVRDLTLHFSPGRDIDPHDMDASIFSCRELTCLSLSGCDIPAAPVGFTGFPNLTWLSLRGVGFRDNGVRDLEALISNCPLLEVLWLHELWFPETEDEFEELWLEECVIQAPNLRDLTIVSEYDFGWRIEALPSIEKVEIDINEHSYDRDFVQLLTTLARVRQLALKMSVSCFMFITGFPNLTWLSLRGVGFPNKGVRDLEALISNCPLLEVLWLHEFWFPETRDELEECIIQAPNLRDLTIVSEYDFGWRIGALPSIEKVEIDFNVYSYDRDFVQLLTTLARVRQLALKMPRRESNALEGLSCCFENLKKLSLHTDFCSLSTILSTTYLLKNAPNLEELSFQIWYENIQEAEVGLDFLNALWASVSLASLKSVSMYLATCQSNEMHFIKFVLSKARRLQKFDICLNEDCPNSNEELLVEILKYRRASPHAKVFFERMTFV